MAKKQETSFGWLYLGLGVAATVGAGYLAWRYLIDESTKANIRKTTVNLVRQGRDMADEATTLAVESGRNATRDAIARVRNS